jgi:hypothetical protein
MVAFLRLRAHRWLKWTAWIILSLGLASAAMGILAASEGFSRPIDPDPLRLIEILTFGSAAVCCSAMVIRSLLARQINPNWNYPQRPPVIPGAPQAFKFDPVQNKVETSAQIATLAENPQSEPAGPTMLSYESQPAQLEPGGWVTVQLLRLRPPPRCCCCLEQTRTLRPYKCGRLANVQLPLCQKCATYYKGEQTWVVLVSALIATVLGVAAAWVVPNRSIAILLVLAGVGCVIGLVGGLGIAIKWAAPAGFSRFSPELNTVRIRFRNPAYLRAVLEAGQVV